MDSAEHRPAANNAADRLDDPMPLLELFQMPMAAWDGAKRKCIFNAWISKITGFSAAELQDTPRLFSRQVHNADLMHWRAHRLRVLSEQRPLSCDYRFYPKGSAEPIWLREIMMPVNTSALGWKSISSYLDITEMKAAATNPAAPTAAKNDVLRGLFHDTNNKLQRLSMEIELAALESQIQPALSRKFTDALIGVNKTLAAIHDQLLGAKPTIPPSGKN
jgi:hypothetical protein